jgi:PKD repeat protein
MRKRIILLLIAAVILTSFGIVKSGLCYKVPAEESKIRYFYVFGADGQKTYGALKTAPQVIFFRVPESYQGNVELAIYDPDVGGSIDEKSNKWDTSTKFSILGGKKAYTSIAEIDESHIIKDTLEEKPINYYEGELLDTKTFGSDKEYDKAYYHFSPIDAQKGEKVGNYRYFKIVVEGLSGDDNNLFSLEILPETVEAFSYAPAIRLSETRGAKMAVYPDMPSDAKKIFEYNYDLDPTGGEIELISSSKAFRINSSATGMWARTEIDVPSNETGKRWVYEITKDRQKDANMALILLTEKGKAIPIFFTPGEKGPKRVFVVAEKPKKEEPWVESKLSCNTFTFDGSKSYDPDKQELSYFWDFGDGTTSNEMRVMHTYKDAGKYLVKLTVTDSSDAECNTATTQQMVKVNQPPCAIADGPALACINDELTFDGSQSTDSPEDKLTYKWDFGDGSTAEGPKVKHRYIKGGSYQVGLTVIDDSGSICDTGMDKIKVIVNTPPIADAGKDVFLCRANPDEPLDVTFDASGSKDPDGDTLSYSWDFGDGQTGEGKVITHTYQKGGSYVATLTVTDNTDTKCNKAVATRSITLNRAPIAKAGTDFKICLSEKANFDASKSIDNDGDLLTYSWDFGDGEKAEGKTVSHKYEKGGVYQVKLMVDDGTKTECSSTSDKILVDVNSIPKAVIASKDTASVGQVVAFDSSESIDPDGDKLTHTWDFGDGASAGGITTKHTYEKGGLYKVVLVVDDGKYSICSSATESRFIKVNTPPVADTGPNLVCCVNDVVEFDGSKSYDADNDKLTYSWDFGDGEKAEGIKVNHAYKNIGVYKVVLTVTDDSNIEGNTSTDSFMATVNAEPVPNIEVM